MYLFNLSNRNLRTDSSVLIDWNSSMSGLLVIYTVISW